MTPESSEIFEGFETMFAVTIVQLFLQLILILALVLGLVEHSFPFLQNFLSVFLEIISTLFSLLSDSQSLKYQNCFYKNICFSRCYTLLKCTFPGCGKSVFLCLNNQYVCVQIVRGSSLKQQFTLRMFQTMSQTFKIVFV